MSSIETPIETPTEITPDPPIKIGVQMIEVKPDDAEQRLDRWLRRVFPQLTQGQIEKMCRKGQLRADGERVKSATRLIEGQMILSVLCSLLAIFLAVMITRTFSA